MTEEQIVSRMKRETIQVAKNCKGIVFKDWQDVKIVLNFLYTKKRVYKYEGLLRKVFVDNHGTRIKN